MSPIVCLYLIVFNLLFYGRRISCRIDEQYILIFSKFPGRMIHQSTVWLRNVSYWRLFPVIFHRRWYFSLIFKPFFYLFSQASPYASSRALLGMKSPIPLHFHHTNVHKYPNRVDRWMILFRNRELDQSLFYSSTLNPLFPCSYRRCNICCRTSFAKIHC